MKSKLGVALAAATIVPRIAMICIAGSLAVISGARARLRSSGAATSSTPSWPVTAVTRRGRVAVVRYDETVFRRFAGLGRAALLVKGSNISSDPTNGIGVWSGTDFKRLMSEGVRPSGVKVAPQMPFAFYKILTPRDLDAVSAYIRSIAPQSNQVQPPVYKAAMHYEDIPGGEKPFTDGALNEPLKRGSLCHDCALHGVPCATSRPRPRL